MLICVSDCTEESRKDETCLKFKMNKYFIETRKIYQKMCVCIKYIIYSIYMYNKFGPVQRNDMHPSPPSNNVMDLKS